MRKLFVLLVVAAALAATGIATSSSPADRFAGLAHVYGGGEFGPGCFTTPSGGDSGVCFGDARAFSLDVLGDGRNFAFGELAYGSPRHTVIKMRVTCMVVAGNRAELGGWVTQATNPAAVGLAMAYWVTDNGSIDSPVPDQASVAWIGTPGSPADFPATFPAKCLPIDGDANAYPIYQDVHGDVVVQHA
jgi:hypothetical protein